MSPLLTPAQVAALLAVSRRTVQRLAESGELPGLRVGSQWRFREQSVRAWMVDREAWPESVALPGPPSIQILPADYEPVFADLAAGGAASKKRGRVRR